MDIEKHSPKWLLNEIKNAKSDAHALFKIIEFQEALHEQCNIANVVVPKETFYCLDKNVKGSLHACKQQCGSCKRQQDIWQ